MYTYKNHPNGLKYFAHLPNLIRLLMCYSFRIFPKVLFYLSMAPLSVHHTYRFTVHL